MKKGQILEGYVKRIDFPNKGIVEIDDYVFTIKNVIEGQKIQFAIQKLKNNVGQGRLIQVLEKSVIETEEAKCKVFNLCGGCNYHTISKDKQLDIKSKQVKNIINNVITYEYDYEGILASPLSLAYRNKMEYSFGDELKDGPICLGLHKRASFYDVITTDDCAIVDDDYNKILSLVLKFALDKKMTYFHKMTKEGFLRHLLIRKAARTNEILVCIITSSQLAAGETFEDVFCDLKDELLNVKLQGVITGILHTCNDSIADIIQNDSTRILYGRDYIYEKLLGMTFKISVYSFFQTNSLGAELLYNKVREYVGDTRDKIIFDLYSGTGTIAQLIASVAKKVVGVEIVEEAVFAARENAKLNGLTNCRFIAGDVLKVIDELDERPDIIILDPPREGVNPKALKKILDFNVDHIIYISCKPTSLARDLETFASYGYRVEKVCAVDMFPQTVHVETVVSLSHKNADTHINVNVEFGDEEGQIPIDEIARKAEDYRPSERVTYKKIQEYIENKYNFKVHTAYIAEVKRGLGLPMYDAPNAVEELKHERKHPTPEKVEAIKEAFKYFGLI